MNIGKAVRPAEGWRIQREAIPQGKSQEPCSVSRRQEGNQMF